MNAQRIKDYIFENELIEEVLSSLNCHHIKRKNGFYSAGNPDGDNISAIVVYENENLTTIDYTRTLVKQSRTTDIFDLVAYFEDLNFPETLRWCCNLFGIEIYEEPEDRPESLQILDMLRSMQTGEEEEDNTPLKPIPEEILSYYIPFPNKLFEDDNIPLSIQEEFEVGYDPFSNYLTIPIRDELGALVGIKGRLLGEPDEFHSKYKYIEPCNKGRLLYGYFQNKDYIKQSQQLFVVESEKGTMQLAGMGWRNAVATSGKKITKTQVELITRTGCTPVFAYDQDVTEKELKRIADMFMDGISVYAIIDRDNILSKKESPSDNPDKWVKLIKNHIYQIK